MHLDLYKESTNAPPIKLPPLQKTTKTPVSTKQLPIEEPRTPSSGQNKDSLTLNEQPTDRVTNGADPATQTDDTKQAKVNVSQEVIYMLLIGKWNFVFRIFPPEMHLIFGLLQDSSQ